MTLSLLLNAKGSIIHYYGFLIPDLDLTNCHIYLH